MSGYKKLLIAVCVGLLAIGAYLTTQYISFRRSMDEKVARQRQMQQYMDDVKLRQEEFPLTPRNSRD